MLMSVVASLNPIELNESEPVDDTNARADYEAWLVGANSPRESTTDMTGTVRNSVKVGEAIFFDLAIKNDGDNDISELTVTVTVTNETGTVLFIDAEDAAVCDDTLSCGIQSFTSGDYLANGHYIVRNSIGTNLVWTPTAPGMYTIHVEIDTADQDTDLNNNVLHYDVNVVDWYDISTELVWDNGDDPMTGAGPHGFTMTAFVNGSASWDPRDVQMDVTMGGLFQAFMEDGLGNTNPVSMFDADGDGSFDDCPQGPGTSTCTWTVSFGNLLGAGQTDDIEVYSNLSMEPPTHVNASDIGETRHVPAFQTAYTFEGTIQGDSATANGVGTFTVQSSLSQYTAYELVTTDYGALSGGNLTGIVNEMMERTATLDDRNGNNDALLTATFATYHDVKVINVEAGWPSQESGRLDSGMTRVFATIAHSGSDRQIDYDWAVTFNVRDSNGDDIMGSPFVATECDNPDDPEGSNGHEYLGEHFPSTLETTACAEIMIDPGMFTVSATVDLLDTTLTDTDSANDCGTGSNPDCKVDMTAPNDMLTSHFEVLNMGPSAYLTMDEIEGDIISGTQITFSARAEHLSQPDMDNDGNVEPFGYSWSMVGSGGLSDPQLDACSGMEDPATGMIMGGSPDCMVTMNPAWFGSPAMIVTVSDYWGAQASAQLTFSVWNNLSIDASGDCWSIEYDILYAGATQFGIQFTDADDATGQVLSGSPGWDSVCTFDLTASEQKAPADVSSEDLVVTVDANPSVGHSLWYEGGTGWVEMTGTTQTQVDADTISLSWSNDGTLPSRSSSRYAVFASATIGQPPQIGVDSLTATLGAAGVIDLSWNIANSQLTGANDYGVLYVNDDGAAIDGTRSTFDLTTTSYSINGEHGKTYEFLVRVENGEVGTDGNALYGTPVDSGSATADGQVDPTAGASSLDATLGVDDISFTWSAADTSDVDHWMICWSPAQHTSLEVTSLISAGNCHNTADNSNEVSIGIHSGSGVFYYSVNAMDSVGNIEFQDSMTSLTLGGDGGSSFVPSIELECTATQQMIDTRYDGQGEIICNITNPTMYSEVVSISISSGGLAVDAPGSLALNSQNNSNFTVIVMANKIDTQGVRTIQISVNVIQINGVSTTLPSTNSVSVIMIVIGEEDSDGDGVADHLDDFPHNNLEWNDTDSDGLGDNSDDCPDEAGSTGENGCPEEEGSNILVVGAATAGAGVVVSTLLFFLFPRMMRNISKTEEMSGKNLQDELWGNEENLPMGPPSELLADNTPRIDLQGVIRPDGYEYIQWPPDEGGWWYRSHAGLPWDEWKN